MYTYHGETMIDLHNNIVEGLAFATPDQLDTNTLVDLSQHNVTCEADSMVWDFDLRDVWLSKARWTMMIRQYLDPEEVMRWLSMCKQYIGPKGRGIAVLRTKTVQRRGGAATGHTNKESRRWGSCMLSLSYKAKPQPTITLHSRTCYVGYLSPLDFTVAYQLARQLAAVLGMEVSQFKFIWNVEALQWHQFKSLAYYLGSKDDEVRRRSLRLLSKPLGQLNEEEYEMATLPAWNIGRMWFKKVRIEDADGITYGDQNYNTYRRVRRRLHSELFGLDYASKYVGWSYYKSGPKEGQEKEYFDVYKLLPSCMVAGLDFERLGLPFQKTIDDLLSAQIAVSTPPSVTQCVACGHDERDDHVDEG